MSEQKTEAVPAEVWAVGNRTSSMLFASEALADQCIAHAGSAAGLQKSKMTVIGTPPATAAQAGDAERSMTLTEALNFFTADERLAMWKQFNCSDAMIANIARAVLVKQAAQPAPEQAAREAAQRERLRARFAQRKSSPATADFDLPAPNDAIDKQAAQGVVALADETLLSIARETGLRSCMHAINATEAKQILRRYVDALAAAQPKGAQS